MTQLTLMLMKIFRLFSVGFEPGTYLRCEFTEKSMYDKKKTEMLHIFIYYSGGNDVVRTHDGVL